MRLFNRDTRLIKTYDGPRCLRRPIAGILGQVRRLYLPQGVDPGTYDVVVDGRGEEAVLRAWETGGYSVFGGQYVLRINPFELPIELLVTGRDERKLRDIGRRVARRYLGTDLERSLEAAFREKYPEWYRKMQDPHLKLSPEERLLRYLRYIGDDIVVGMESWPDVEVNPDFSKVVLKLSRRYLKDGDIQKHITIPDGVHETSHKVIAEQTKYRRIMRTIMEDEELWEAADDEHAAICSSGMGDAIKRAFEDKKTGDLKSLGRAVIRRKERAIERRLGRGKMNRYVIWSKLGGLDENLARATCGKLAGEEQDHDRNTIYGYVFGRNFDVVTGDSLERIRDFLRTHRYRDVLDMGLLGCMRTFQY